MSAPEDEASKIATAVTDHPTPSVVAAEPVVPTTEDAAAAAAAAAAATNTSMVISTEAVAPSPQPPTHLPSEALATAAAAAATVEVSAAAAGGRVSLLNDVDGQGKRRFFPRVKHLIGNKEWEDFLTQVLQCIEEAGAPEAAAASHKANNAWYKAFDLIYGGVAREYSIPTGKNRYHKFKDKILEVWVALEAQAPGENHCRDLALEQYERYKRACAEVNKSSAGGGHHHHHHHLQSAPNKAGKIGAGHSAGGSASGKLAGGKRSFSTAMGGGPVLYAPSGTAALWKNLEEASVLGSLPEHLRSLVHLKQLSKEMAACTGNRATRKGIEEHSKKLDGAYLEALVGFLRDGEEITAAENPAGVKAEEQHREEAADVEMADGEDAGKEAGNQAATAGAASSLSAYDRCLAVAFLHRYASTVHEKQMLSDAYIKYTARCVNFDSSSASASNNNNNSNNGEQASHPMPDQPPPPTTTTNHGGEAAATTVAAVEASRDAIKTEVDEVGVAAAAVAEAVEANPAFPVEVQI
eukprot:CAMPEP_0197178646 /NCGR_PEP_ID=MMETSP1423-20130617/3864_1 /TAXON_ID=476441 /ORGANISM="Pseudo-nitzschia heimii, Strain UNC1101" /LENGTH=523 /DNA_ID=CAMNT_0042628429 /DNA_START=280 /DNA_END=1851 /DNA_ORIENTATION=-